MNKKTAQELKEANDAKECEAICCIAHGNLITAIEAAVETAREDQNIPAIVLAFRTSEVLEEENALQHMVGLMAIMPAMHMATIAVDPGEFKTPPNDPLVN